MSYKDKAGKSTASNAPYQPTGPDECPELRCTAIGCRLAWSVDSADKIKLCSYHAWVDPKEWPRVTEELHRIGKWKLSRSPESHTVKDMKTRVKSFKSTGIQL